MGPQQDPDDPPRWTTYFAADDAAATAARIKEAGGTVLVEPMEVGPMGTMVIALDPQGNPFGLWQSGFNTGVRIYNEPGALAWNEAMVDDTAAAKQFYSHGLRFPVRPDGRRDGRRGEGIDYATFSTGGNPLGGLGGTRPEFAEGLADLLRGELHRRGGGGGRGERRQGRHAGDGHAVRPVRHRRGPLGSAVRGDGTDRPG